MPTRAIGRKTPAMVKPPKTAPSCTDSHAYAVTNRKINSINEAKAAIADQMKKADGLNPEDDIVTPTFSRPR
jgi:hypothetical protein